ncbi:hybrid sensor histidine kinase/response regulator transcription factor [Labilibacter marinus]|uniref:hybrid sensor histidine kinase/response regulator transcription factor n=1 Tax=Labilibacter marinus TaxID=1477105 RepID=UPI000833BA65|nr:hybrid sensor histidine kinase/response regulator transcription factor [Labilibacter marinus]
MSETNFKKYLLLLLIVNFTCVSAQINDIKFRRISPVGGFTLKGINSITQDNIGYIWIGTNQGLIRYDSQHTNWFIPSIKESLSLPNEFINDVFADGENNLWVSTNQGLCRFNRQEQNFSKIKYTYEDQSIANDSVITVAKTADNKLLVIDAFHFGILDISSQIMTRIGTHVIQSPNYLYTDHQNRVWIGTRTGDVFRFYPKSNKLTKIITKQYNINCIYSDYRHIWVGTEGNGAHLYDIEGNFIRKISFNKNCKANNGHVRIIKKDTYGRIWYGCYEGLFMDNGKKIKHFKQDDYNGLPHNSIYEIFEDKQGGIWIGTWSGGVSLIHHSDNNFKSFRHQPLNNSISNNTVSSFLQLNDQEILIGTEVGGLNTFDLNTQKFSAIELGNDANIQNIKTICKDINNDIWVGTFRNGLWRKKAKNKKFEPIDLSINGQQLSSSTSVYSLCAEDSGIWVGTLYQGLLFYHFNTKTTTRCFNTTPIGKTLSDRPIQSILKDSNSNLWLGTLFGFLYKIDLPTGQVSRLANKQFLSEYRQASIYCLYEFSSGEIWIGTKNNGILIYHPGSHEYETFDANGLLKGKDIYGIIEDKQKRIWITSNDGLVLYHPTQNSFRHFLHADGIQSNLFCPQSIYQDSNSNLYFGGTNGFTTINPFNVKINTKKPTTFINHITLNNNEKIHLNYSFNKLIDPIILKPNNNTFRIHFSADNYLMPEKNRYKYRLANYNDNWIHTNSVGSALFNNMKAGDYIFEVKACNNDGIWNDTPTQLNIKIENFWYKTPWALLIYTMLLGLFIYFISHFYIERIKLQRAILHEKNQRENEEQIHEMKLKFFTNISHEFRTPLTLISWPINKLIKADNITHDQREELEVIKSSSNRLLQLINQIIDLRKLERGKSKLNISKFDIIEFTKLIQKSFSSESKARQIDFILDSSFDSIRIEADREKVDTIIYNLLSNAYKYVSDGGTIKASINNSVSTNRSDYNSQLSFGELHVDEYIEIAIEDNGIGIESESLFKIFNRFEQVNEGNKNRKTIKGSGIGLSICKEFTLLHHGKIIVQSNAGKGSCFTLLLPTKQKAQKMLYESHQEVKNYNKGQTELTAIEANNTPLDSHTILVVEDNPDFSKFICKYLKQYYQVVYASNGEEALQVIKNRNIDLIVSDVMMPKMDGIEFCTIVKTKVETSHIPVILLTALSSSENMVAGLDKGADAYITKPFDELVLLKQIQNILKQRQRIRENFSKQFTSEKTIEVGSLDNFFLNRVKAVIEKNISEENFGIEMLTEELMISRSQLHRKIKSLSGLSTSDFVNLVRVKLAIELVKTSNCTFNEVAFKVGFSSQSYFTKCFKKAYNTTPKAYFYKH